MITDMTSPVWGDVTVIIEGLGTQVVSGCRGISALNAVNIAGGALTKQFFSATPDEWKAAVDGASMAIYLFKNNTPQTQ